VQRSVDLGQAAAGGLQFRDRRPARGGREAEVRAAARVPAQRVHQDGTAIRVRPAAGENAGAVRVAGRAEEGAHVAGRARRDDAGRRRAVRPVHVRHVSDAAAPDRPARAAVHEGASAAPAQDAPGRDRQAAVQEGPNRVPEAQAVRARTIRTPGPQRRAKAVRLLRAYADAQRGHILLRGCF